MSIHWDPRLRKRQEIFDMLVEGIDRPDGRPSDWFLIEAGTVVFVPWDDVENWMKDLFPLSELGNQLLKWTASDIGPSKAFDSEEEFLLFIQLFVSAHDRAADHTWTEDSEQRFGLNACEFRPEFGMIAAKIAEMLDLRFSFGPCYDFYGYYPDSPVCHRVPRTH